MGEISGAPRPDGSARRAQGQRRRDRMRKAGPVEAFTAEEIGHRDGWVCGICQDRTRLVDPSPGAPRALSPSVDHVVAVSAGGPHARANVRITHLWCNVERGNGRTPSPKYMRARLSQVLDGVPVPEELHRSRAPSWRWPASRRVEYMIALYITAGWVTGDPRYSDPATRLADIAVQRFGTAADDAVKSDLQWVDEARQRRAEMAAWWRAAIKATPGQQ
jgi:hypothetical protein